MPNRTRFLGLVAAASAFVVLTVACSAPGLRTASGGSRPTVSPTSSAALTCPRRAPISVPRHQRAGTSVNEVPGQPVSLLACRYHGLNQPQASRTLARWARVPPSSIAAGLNGAPVVDPTLYSCPADFGETILLIFGYQDGSRLLVQIGTAGCRFATNGDHFVRTPSIGHLEELLGHDES